MVCQKSQKVIGGQALLRFAPSTLKLPDFFLLRYVTSDFFPQLFLSLSQNKARKKKLILAIIGVIILAIIIGIIGIWSQELDAPRLIFISYYLFRPDFRHIVGMSWFGFLSIFFFFDFY